MKRLLFSITVILVLQACSGPEDPHNNALRPDFDQIPVYNIENLFRITTFNEADFFASISHIAAGEDNTIFVSDPRARKIYLFDQDGKYKEYLGGDGEGPGEFRQIGTVTLLAPDTLQVVDWQLARITFFTIKDDRWAAVKYLDRPAGAREFGSDIFFAFNSFYPHTNGYLGRFTSSFTPVDTAMHSFAYYTKFDYDLNPLDNREYLMHVVTKPMVTRRPGGSVSIMPVPESHRTLYSIQVDGYKISSWTGNNRIQIRHITGGDSTGFEFPSSRVLITEKERTELLERQIPDSDNAMMIRDQLRDHIPHYKGYSRQLITDDQDRIWILTWPFEEGDPEWLIYSKEGDLLAAAHHPSGSIMQIKNDRVYVSFTSADEEPVFGVYVLRE